MRTRRFETGHQRTPRRRLQVDPHGTVSATTRGRGYSALRLSRRTESTPNSGEDINSRQQSGIELKAIEKTARGESEGKTERLQRIERDRQPVHRHDYGLYEPLGEVAVASLTDFPLRATGWGSCRRGRVCHVDRGNCTHGSGADRAAHHKGRGDAELAICSGRQHLGGSFRQTRRPRGVDETGRRSARGTTTLGRRFGNNSVFDRPPTEPVHFWISYTAGSLSSIPPEDG